MKVLLILSNESEKKYYRPILALFKEKNIRVDFAIFTWKYQTQLGCAQEIITKFKNKELENYYIFGFSISALVAILIASESKVKGLILISPTPLFSDTIYPKWVKKLLGKKRLTIAKSTKIKDLQINSKKTFLLVGEQEDNEVLRQSTAFAKVHKRVNLKNINNTGHAANTPEMIVSIKQTIMQL